MIRSQLNQRRLNYFLVMDPQMGNLRFGLQVCILLGLSAGGLSLNWQSDSATCGRVFQSMSSLIMGGKPAAEFAWPWQVAMLENGAHVCGASLVDPSWVLTAAHCINRTALCEENRYSFRVGSNNLHTDTDVTQVRVPSKIFVHPNYEWDENKYDYDIALVKMSKPFEKDSTAYKVNTVCLPTSNMADQFIVGKEAVVTGWGKLEEYGENPDDLYEAKVRIMNDDQCQNAYGQFTKNMLCAGVDGGEQDACQGDSGGPLVTKTDANPDQYYVIGVVNYGGDCSDDDDNPGVYARVTKYEDWLRPIFNGMIPESHPCNEGALSGPDISTIFAILPLSIAVNIFIFV